MDSRPGTIKVAVIGTGPSGLHASAVLSGAAVPYYARPHPNALIHTAVSEALAASPLDDPSLLDLDLAALSDSLGLTGRSTNPVALLADVLLRPGADGHGPTGGSCVETRRRAAADWPLRVALYGRQPGGGSWGRMPEHTPTLSPAQWLELPGLDLQEALRAEGGQSAELTNHPGWLRSRVARRFVAAYYRHYEGKLIASEDRVDRRYPEVVVERVARLPEGGYHLLITDANPPVGGAPSREEKLADAVVLAVGTYDSPRRLGVPGEDRAVHRAPRWTTASTGASATLVVGAGLSAADAIVAALGTGRKVYHVFRGDPRHTKIAAKFGSPSPMYREYYDLVRLMLGDADSAQYTPFAASKLAMIRPNLDDPESHDCVIESEHEGSSKSEVLKVADVVVLVGASASLSFADDGTGATSDEPLEFESLMSASAGRGKTTHPVYADVDPTTMEVRGRPGSFAVGPLRGDNFIRFLAGDAWAVASTLLRRVERAGRDEL